MRSRGVEGGREPLGVHAYGGGGAGDAGTAVRCGAPPKLAANMKPLLLFFYFGRRFPVSHTHSAFSRGVSAGSVRRGVLQLKPC